MQEIPLCEWLIANTASSNCVEAQLCLEQTKIVFIIKKPYDATQKSWNSENVCLYCWVVKTISRVLVSVGSDGFVCFAPYFAQIKHDIAF